MSIFNTHRFNIGDIGNDKPLYLDRESAELLAEIVAERRAAKLKVKTKEKMKRIRNGEPLPPLSRLSEW